MTAAGASIAARVDRFEFEGWALDLDAARVSLHYRLAPHWRFTEEIHFEGATRKPDPDALAPRLRLLHLLAGVSYYKAACPAELLVRYPVPAKVLAFVREVYRQGLGEFSMVNGLSLDDRLIFRALDDPEPVAPPAAVERGVVVPLGGGKDSLVSVDRLERAGLAFRTIAVGASPLIAEVADSVDVDHIAIRRRLDPLLFELNDHGAYNGHVPITAVLAAVLAVGAAFYGYDTIVLSNERSAEAPTRHDAQGRAVNHQYSKTLAFERDLGAVLATEAAGLRYFSLLRPWSELAITRHFAGLERFHGVFSSCNRNFQLRGSASRRWCRDCPKCRFVYLALAPFMPRDLLVDIFGGDLLDDPEQLAGFEALLGVDGEKPFECVGETAESRAALGAIAEHPDWRERVVVAALRGRVPGEPLEPWLAPAAEHLIPTEFVDVALGRG